MSGLGNVVETVGTNAVSTPVTSGDERVNIDGELYEKTTIMSYIGELSIIFENHGNSNKAVWAEAKIAINIATWAYPDFAFQVAAWMQKLLTNGIVALENAQVKAIEDKLEVANQRSLVLEGQLVKANDQLTRFDQKLVYAKSRTVPDVETPLRENVFLIEVRPDIFDIHHTQNRGCRKLREEERVVMHIGDVPSGIKLVGLVRACRGIHETSDFLMTRSTIKLQNGHGKRWLIKLISTLHNNTVY